MYVGDTVMGFALVVEIPKIKRSGFITGIRNTARLGRAIYLYGTSFDEETYLSELELKSLRIVLTEKVNPCFKFSDKYDTPSTSSS